MNKENPHALPEPPEDASDDEAVREYGRQLAIDALLRDALGTGTAGESEAPPGKVVAARFTRSRRKTALLTGAAACLAGLLAVSIWKGLPGRQGGAALGSASPALHPHWLLDASANADYSIVNPGLVELRRGELRFTSLGASPLVVKTPQAVATAQDTRFFIGHHAGVLQPDNTTMKKHTKTMTRLLVLAGTVTMTTPAGSLRASENEAAVAADGNAPEKIAVGANSRFAFDLYAQLAAENKGESIFFSPYSVSTALMMTAEGARGKTAEEMGQALGFSKALRRIGEDAQRIPWETAKMHTGMSRLSHLFNRKETPEEAALREKAEGLEKLLAESKARTAEAKSWDERMENIKKEKEIANRINALREKTVASELSLANALWGERDYPYFKKPYLETIRGAYGTGALRLADFKKNPEAERKNINGWVEGLTKGRIKDLVPQGEIDELTRLVLVNAIHFKGNWAIPFNAAKTEEADFLLAGGGSAKVPLMKKLNVSGMRYAAFNGDGSFFNTPAMVDTALDPDMAKNKGTLYPKDDGFTMLELPYQGGGLSMVVIVPSQAGGLAAIESKLDSGQVAKWIGQLKPRKVHVSLPRFQSGLTCKMKDTLQAMGIERAFADPRSGDGADFSGLSSATNPEEKLYIKNVFHKSFIEVNEKGTEAAAATAVVMPAKASAPREWPFTPEFRADKPFIYLIRENQTGSILFLGRMMDPSKT